MLMQMRVQKRLAQTWRSTRMEIVIISNNRTQVSMKLQRRGVRCRQRMLHRQRK
jgi:hypothetical protein